MAEMTSPMDLFEHELRDILYAERQIEKTLPKLAKEASDPDLQEAFTRHRDETRQQIANLERVFEIIGKAPRGTRCPGIEGLMTEHDEFVSDENPAAEILDVFLTGAGARVEHYEIAAYTGLVTAATALGQKEAADLLQENLRQEKDTLSRLEALGTGLLKTAAAATA